MRYRTGHKEATRERIVRVASQKFRKKGAEGVAIADLMKELRLTHGGFYRHFTSKQQLFIEALKKAMEDGDRFLNTVTRNAPEGKELNLIIETYLSKQHCEEVQNGCPVAALAAELPRQSRAVRAAFNRTIGSFIKRVAEFVPGVSIKERESRARVLFSGMVGTLTMARSMEDPAIREELLRSSREMYIRAFCNR